jgi:hypothetical protein
MKRKFPWKRVSLAGAVMGCCFAAGVYASDGVKQIAAYLYPNVNVVVDGRNHPLADPVLSYEGRMYVPIRAVSDIFNASAAWNGDTWSIHITLREDPGKSADTSAGSVMRPQNGGAKANFTFVSVQNKKIEFYSVLKYEVTYQNKQYQVLANQHPQDSTLYFRLDDLLAMGLQFGYVDVYAEKETGQHFVTAQDLKNALDGEMLFALSEEPVATGINDEKKLKALKSYRSNPIYIRPLKTKNRYEILYQKANGTFYADEVEVVAGSKNSYSVRYKKRTDFYKD